MGIGTSFNEGGTQQSSMTNKLVALYRRPEQGQTTTPGTHCPTLFELCAVSFTSRRIMNMKSYETGPTVYRPYPRRQESLKICEQMTKEGL